MRLFVWNRVRSSSLACSGEVPLISEKVADGVHGIASHTIESHGPFGAFQITHLVHIVVSLLLVDCSFFAYFFGCSTKDMSVFARIGCAPSAVPSVADFRCPYWKDWVEIFLPWVRIASGGRIGANDDMVGARSPNLSCRSRTGGRWSVPHAGKWHGRVG